MRKKIVAGNWKMNKSCHEAILLAESIVNQLAQSSHKGVTVVLATPFPYLQQVYHITEKALNVFTGAQDCAKEEFGAFTGQVSAPMIFSTGAKYVIVGHSERRNFCHETDKEINLKLKLAIKNGLTPILCVGERVDERNSGKHKDVISSQLNEALLLVSSEEVKNIVIAYEPVWAIGTGQSATPEQAQEIHSLIRSGLQHLYGSDVASSISIIYGGSCNSSNSKELFSQPDIDGGLIGSASLNSEEFLSIINSFPAKS